MEENKKRKDKRKGRFNVLDLIIIIVLIFAISIALILTIPKIRDRVQAGEKVRISYTVVFYNVDSSVFDQIASGQTLTDIVGGKILGMVSEPPETELSYSYVIETNENGDNVLKKQEDSMGKRNIIVTVEADARYSEGEGYTVDGYRIAVGKEMQIRFPNYTDTGYCTGIIVIG